MKTHIMLLIFSSCLEVWGMKLPNASDLDYPGTPEPKATTPGGTSLSGLACSTMIAVPVRTEYPLKETLSPYEGHTNGYLLSRVARSSRVASSSQIANPSRLGTQSTKHPEHDATPVPSPSCCTKHLAHEASNNTSASFQCPTDLPGQSTAFDNDLFVAILFGVLGFATALVNIWLQYLALQRQQFYAGRGARI
ncbi:uncharacterized protein K452DRAFT_285931 [Aplosporella prunicola CBS 121167]|uniref:Copper transporter n=1 Tax=Aplosporella prunicola CBS 121167 TaxID=1176127 RepID=A0A6A6BKI1_9PEZI|nr:uncharacterized protein K452DRAFT_285931 [Aplosporella prunicola CBS 121167]KAF2143893.1 hypothetical protein K452DRAFT_285931 [Aplosporella prunicola CBS 121167]